MLKRVDTAVFNFVKSVGDGTVQTGDVRFSLKNDGIDYSMSNPTALGDLPTTLTTSSSRSSPERSRRPRSDGDSAPAREGGRLGLLSRAHGVGAVHVHH